MTPLESEWTPSSEWCPQPSYWHAETGDATEIEVSELVAGFVRALQPELVVETGTNTGQTAAAIGRALLVNGHGRLYSLECEPTLAQQAETCCVGLPVTVIWTDSLTWEPPSEIGFAWFDSSAHCRHLEIQAYWEWLAPDAIVGIHDTGPQHPVAGYLAPLVEAGRLAPITLRTPRGVTFAQVRK